MLFEELKDGNMSTAKVFKNLISLNDINSIVNFYQSQDEQNTEKGIINKNLFLTTITK